MNQTVGVDAPGARLTLLVAGDSPATLSARTNLTRLVGEVEVDASRVRIVDVLKEPQIALRYRAFFTPSLIVDTAAGTTTIVGDLVDVGEVRRLLLADDLAS
ncbi:circadian clock KaiB family protein [Agreia sp. COWG]|uniref:circadian clock KaiB family protein n=1 Tax=Agreia sp. COWG TaxID=2773266 RepID=UPI001929512F|nr:circadian clock KaiB family protein [Agreia sp. COWG]CAD5995317.1 Circadian clock protein KaiB [Agreia sp. COWG]